MLIDADIHQTFTQTADMASSAYVEMRDRLRQFMVTDHRIRDICTMIRAEGTKRWKIVIDVAPTRDRDDDEVISRPEKPAPLGELVDAASSPEVNNGLEGAFADKEIHRGKRGWWLSGYAPIHNSAREAVAVLRLDFSADAVKKEMSEVREIILYSCIFFLALALMAASAYARRLTKPMDEVVTVTEKIAQGEYDQRIDVTQKGELGQLAESVNTMAESLRKNFDKVSTLNRMADVLSSTLNLRLKMANILLATLDLRTALEMSLNLALQVTKSAKGAIFLIRERKRRLELGTSQGIEGMQVLGDECFVGEQKLNTAMQKDLDAQIKEWLDITGCTRYFFLKIKDNLQGVFLLSPEVGDEAFLNTLMAEISFGIENARLFRDATTDSTTGLFMKRYFKIQLDTEAKKLQMYKRGLSLLMLDIDGFKQINDTYGHQFGDLVLIEIAKIITHSVRDSDMVARYGGDEIVIILPDSSKENARMVADRIRAAVEAYKFPYEEKTVRITVSIGLSHMTVEEPVPSEQLLRRADAALYEAKEAGRNTIQVA
jgi:diguanylate cyclase (GGDEF)-like protein